MPDSNYQKIGHATITPLMMGGAALDAAIQNYSKYAKMDFWTDLEFYLRTGYVICTPTVFAMFKPIDRGGKRGWFVQMAVGNLLDLLRFTPCPLDFIAWCRNDDDNMRVVNWDYFIKKVMQSKGLKIS